MVRRDRASSREPTDRGFTIVEVVAALGILAVVSVGLVTSTRAGLGLIGTSNGRQTATQLATRWMEDARSIDYSALGMDPTTTYETDPTTPDAGVDPVALNFTWNGITESLDVMPAGQQGVVHHVHEIDNGQSFALYRYVTWMGYGIDAQAIKRVTVVAQWAGTDSNGVPNRVVLSTLVSTDGVLWAGSGTTTTTAVPSSTTTSTTATTVPSSTTTTTAGSCGSDATSPTGTIRILDGTGANPGWTNSTTVTLNLTASASCQPISMQFAADGTTTWSAWEPYNTVKTYGPLSGEGAHTVYVRYKDGRGTVSPNYSAAITVDVTAPTMPNAFDVKLYQNPNRVDVMWNKSSDNFQLVGYYVFRKVGSSGAYQNVASVPASSCTGANCDWVDNNVFPGGSYTYYVVAYDAAGNQSSATVTRTISL